MNTILSKNEKGPAGNRKAQMEPLKRNTPSKGVMKGVTTWIRSVMPAQQRQTFFHRVLHVMYQKPLIMATAVGLYATVRV